MEFLQIIRATVTVMATAMAMATVMATAMGMKATGIVINTESMKT